jgi:ABC-2 type transport system ATP-binding protein
MEAIVTRNLSKIYKGLGKTRKKSLDNLNLVVNSEEVFGFLGRNGAGKTTTIKLLCSLIKPTSGDALIHGVPIRSSASRKYIGYLPEQPYFYEYLTPRETISFYGLLRGLSAADRAREWDKLSELLDLQDIADQHLKGFSKGMRQRVGFAVALIGDPPILILDEPMSGLDPLGRRNMREIIFRLRDARKTLFLSSHVLGDVEQICDKVAILVQGRLMEQGRLDELLGSSTKQVEIIASGLNETTCAQIKTKAVSWRSVDEQEIFIMPDHAAGNQAAQQILASGARLVDYSPVKESLEDYFMRKQEPEKGTGREVAP